MSEYSTKSVQPGNEGAYQVGSRYNGRVVRLRQIRWQCGLDAVSECTHRIRSFNCRTSKRRPVGKTSSAWLPAFQLRRSTYRPPSTRRMGLPVRVMEMSDKKRLPATLGTVLVADRTAEREDTILAIGSVAATVACPPNCTPRFGRGSVVGRIVTAGKDWLYIT